MKLNIVNNLSPCLHKKLVYGSMPLELAETRPRSNFPESRVGFPRYNQAKHRRNNILAGTVYVRPSRSSTTRSHTCQHHAEITQSHTLAALIRLFTTTHNLLTFNISEISSNNSEKLSLLPDKHLWTFLLHSSYSSSRMYSHTVGGSPYSLALFSFHTRKKLSLGLGQSSLAILLSANSFDS